MTSQMKTRRAPSRSVAAKKGTARKAPSKDEPAASRAAPKKIVARKVAARTAAARKPASRPALDYDPRAQLDKLSVTRATTTRGAAQASTIDIDAVLGEFFALRRDEPLTPDVAVAAALELGIEVAALRAIAQVESGGAGFDGQGRPKILYERQVFSRSTTPKGRFDALHPDISAPKGYGPGHYGTADQQWPKLARAYQLDGDAALKACSWGTFQILGENHKVSGFPDVRSFVAEMFASPAGHLRALVRFIRANPSIHRGLKTHDWAAVAKGYNGSSYRKFGYDTKLAAAYENFKAQG